MQFNHLISAIMRGVWLLEPQWAQDHLPLVARLLKGESVDFGQIKPVENVAEVMQMATRGYQVRYGTNITAIPEGSVAIIDVNGPIIRRGGACSYGLEDTGALLRRVYNAGNIIGAVLNMDTPGGQSSGTASFASLVRNAPKPVVGYVDDGMAASAGEWIISQCAEVYVSNNQCRVGSIGAFTTLVDFSQFFEEQGIKVHEIYAPQSTDKNKIYYDAMEGDYAGVQKELSGLVDMFIAEVKAGRGSRLNTSKENPFTGKMYAAPDAKKIGLIDGISTLEAAVDRVQKLAKKSVSNKKTNMSQTNNKPTYNRIGTAAGWANGHEATEEGIFLTHDDAAKVEAALEAGEKNKETAGKVGQLQADLDTAKSSLATAERERDEWKVKAEEYGNDAANKGTNPATTGDTHTDETPKKTYDPVTAAAINLYNRNKK